MTKSRLGVLMRLQAQRLGPSRHCHCYCFGCEDSPYKRRTPPCAMSELWRRAWQSREAQIGRAAAHHRVSMRGVRSRLELHTGRAASAHWSSL